MPHRYFSATITDWPEASQEHFVGVNKNKGKDIGHTVCIALCRWAQWGVDRFKCFSHKAILPLSLTPTLEYGDWEADMIPWLLIMQEVLANSFIYAELIAGLWPYRVNSVSGSSAGFLFWASKVLQIIFRTKIFKTQDRSITLSCCDLICISYFNVKDACNQCGKEHLSPE